MQVRCMKNAEKFTFEYIEMQREKNANQKYENAGIKYNS
jgi:hypothetical protein